MKIKQEGDISINFRKKNTSEERKAEKEIFWKKVYKEALK